MTTEEREDGGAALRRLRLARGLSLAELARRTHYSKGYLSKVETGEKGLTDGVARQCDEVLTTGGELAALVAAGPQGCPYRGLRGYEAEDARWFFGRRRAVGALVTMLAGRAAEGGPLAVVAASGAGKSSLLRAGLVPALRRPRQAGSRSRALVFTPGSRPVDRLTTRLDTLGDGRGGEALLVVDQFEEIFTLCDDETERRAFVETLHALSAERRAPVVLGVRADFYGRCLAYPALVDAFRAGHYPLGPMTEAELREVITGPARAAGLDLEPGLVELLLRDLGTVPGGTHEPGALPLLSHALLATWQQRRGGALTVEGYRETGGIAGAVALTAEQVHHGLGRDRRELARRVLLQMVCVGEDNAETRRPLDPGRLPPEHFPPEATREVIEEFVRARLLTRDDGHVQPAHEALLRAWPQMREWILADRAGLRTHRRLAEAAEVWAREGRDASHLYRGTRLRAADEWAASHPAALTTPERDFLDACLAAEAAERAALRRRSRRRHLVIALLTALLAVSAGATVFATQQRDLARTERTQAAARQLAAQGELLTGDPATSARLATTAWRLAPGREVRASMASLLSRPDRAVLPGEVYALASSPDGAVMAAAMKSGFVQLYDVARRRPIGSLTGPGEPAGSVAFSPDGRLLAAGQWDGTARLWDVATRRPVGAPLTVDGDMVLGVAFSGDGRTLFTVDDDLVAWDVATGRRTGRVRLGDVEWDGAVAFSRDGGLLAVCTGGSVRLWDTAERREVRSLSLRETPEQRLLMSPDTFSGMVFSPDGRTLAVAVGSGVRLWDVATGRRIGAPLTGGDAPISALAFSPDGSALAGGDASGVRLWDVTTGQRSGAELIGHTGPPLAMAFSADGATLWTHGDETVRVWDVVTRRQVGPPLTGFRLEVMSVAFSPDGRTVAAASRDNTVQVWDVATRRRRGAPLTAFDAQFSAVAFSPDGATLATAGHDGKVRLWDVAEHRQTGDPFTGHEIGIVALAFSPDGRTLATAGDSTVRLWDVASRRLLGPPLAGHAGPEMVSHTVLSVAFSPDGKTLASGGGDGTIRLWDAASHRLLGPPLTGHDGGARSVVFSPDGRTLASGGDDRAVRLWDVATRRQLGSPLTGHDGVVTSVAFGPGGDVLASTGRDTTVRLWDVAARRELGPPLTGHGRDVSAVRFHPDGRTLATSSFDGTVRLWDVALPRDLFTALCDIAGRSFTPAEWRRHVPGEEYRPVCREKPLSRR